MPITPTDIMNYDKAFRAEVIDKQIVQLQAKLPALRPAERAQVQLQIDQLEAKKAKINGLTIAKWQKMAMREYVRVIINGKATLDEQNAKIEAEDEIETAKRNAIKVIMDQLNEAIPDPEEEP